jgi:hypothetical protein
MDVNGDIRVRHVRLPQPPHPFRVMLVVLWHYVKKGFAHDAEIENQIIAMAITFVVAAVVLVGAILIQALFSFLVG